MAAMEAKYKEENQRIQKYCKDKWGEIKRWTNDSLLKESMFKKYAQGMIFDFEHGLGWCPHAKVASTTLLTHFNRLSNPEIDWWDASRTSRFDIKRQILTWGVKLGQK